jgi:hypothetical protein
MGYEFNLCLSEIREKVRTLDPMESSVLEVEFLLRNAMHILEENNNRRAIQRLAHTREKEGSYLFHPRSAAELKDSMERVKTLFLIDIGSLDECVEQPPTSFTTLALPRIELPAEDIN